MFNIEHGIKSINLWLESMAKNVSLAWINCQPHHSSKYAIGPYQASKHALGLNHWGIQFGLLALDGSRIFGECKDHDWSCAISSKVVGCFYWRFPCGHELKWWTLRWGSMKWMKNNNYSLFIQLFLHSRHWIWGGSKWRLRKNSRKSRGADENYKVLKALTRK